MEARPARLYFSAILILLVVVCYPPRELAAFSADDFLILTALRGSEPLHQLGFSIADPQLGLWQKLTNTFHFFDPDAGTTASMKRYGALPWWTPDDAKMHMFRPLSSLTHWLDLRVFGGSMLAIQLHSLFWMLALAMSLFAAYRRLLGIESLAFFASLLFVLDINHQLNFYWMAARNAYIAPFFGIWALLFHHSWREDGGRRYLLFSCISLLLALLSAEAGIATAAYLGAYALVLDRQGRLAGLKALLPAVVVVLCWRLIYSLLGFGADNISLYLDPLNSPIDFLQSLASNYAFLAVSMITSVFRIQSNISPDLVPAFTAFALLFVGFCLLLIWPLLRQDARIRFFVLGCAFAIVPFCAQSEVTARSLPFIAIGFSAGIAAWLVSLVRDNQNIASSFIKRTALIIVIGWHAVVPLVISLMVTFTQNSLLLNPTTAENLKQGMTGSDGQRVVYVNYPSAGHGTMLPYRWAQQGLDIPERIYQLVPGLNSYELKRLGKREFQLNSTAMFAISKEAELHSVGRSEHNFDPGYVLLRNQSFTSNSDREYKPGQQIRGTDMTIEILALLDGLPSEVKIRFDDAVDPDELLWVQWKWRAGRFDVLTVPALGQSIRIKNNWDSMD